MVKKKYCYVLKYVMWKVHSLIWVYETALWLQTPLTQSHFNQAILTLHFTFNVLDLGWVRFVCFRLTAKHSIISTTVRKPN